MYKAAKACQPFPAELEEIGNKKYHKSDKKKITLQLKTG
jgi:hypothetical protein